MEFHLYPHLTKEANLKVYNLVSLTANPIKIPMKLSKTSEKRKLTCDLHFLQNHRFQDGRSEFLLRLKKMYFNPVLHSPSRNFHLDCKNYEDYGVIDMN